MGKRIMGKAEEIIAKIWTPPERFSTPGAWFWWFWLFFIHDKDTEKTGKCRQVMILWSIKNDRKIKCNDMDIEVQRQISKLGKKFLLDGAAAAWYFDGKRMHHEFVLEKTKMALDPASRSLIAPGKTPSRFYQDKDEFVTEIKTKEHSFEFRAKKIDGHPAVGPTHGSTKFPFGMGIEGTRLEIMRLSGFETLPGGEKKEITGTAYFQKILVAVPPPPWYWGLYHFKDGSFFTYMMPYVGRAMLHDNLWGNEHLHSPLLKVNPDILFYHAPTSRVWSGHALIVTPEKIPGTPHWRHRISGKGEGFEITAVAEAYSHSSWKFKKNIGMLPIRSVFRYNEYPSTIDKLEVDLSTGEKIALRKGWGNMENAWGFVI